MEPAVLMEYLAARVGAAGTTAEPALRAALAASGVGAAALVGATPVLRGGGGRSAEVLAWLAAHPEVRSWAVVDDEGTAFRADPALEGRLLLTASEVGLTEDIADQALAVLLRK